MFQRISCCIALILFTLPVSAYAFQGYVQSFGDGGTIAWGSGEISVVRPLVGNAEESGQRMSQMLVRKATSQARKQMLDMVMGVRIDAKQTISAFLTGDDALAVRVRGMIQNSQFERPALFGEGGEVRVSESFHGKLAELVLPTTIQFQSGIPPKLSTSMEQSFSFDNSEPEAVGVGGILYTGLIVDARGLKVTPALAPVIYGQDGLGAYGPFSVSRTNAIANGVVAYATSASPDALRERVGSKPLTVKALSAYGSWRTDLVISSSMARLVRVIMRPGDIVDTCRVVIVIDPPIRLVGEESATNGGQLAGEEL